MSKIEPITFKNNNEKTLFGMLHLPDNADPKYAIIISSPGIKSRVAPHRLYVKMASLFADMGYNVLRFDPEGLGDSEGEIIEQETADVYGSIEVGRLIDDTITAMDWMEGNGYAEKFILTGLCGGAITGLLTGAVDQRITSIIGLGLPAILASAKVDKLKYITDGQLTGMRKKYFEKIFKLKSWARLLTFKSDYRLLAKAVLRPLISKIKKPDVKPTTESNKKPLQSVDTNLNPYFPKAMASMGSTRKLLLIFSGSDRLYHEFREKYMVPYEMEFAEIKANVQIEIIPDANHILSYIEWQDTMNEIIDAWMRRYYIPTGNSKGKGRNG